MEPGREFDALVAEKVFDDPWPLVKLVFQPSDYLHLGPWWCIEALDKSANSFINRTLPRYTTDIAAAWPVFEKLRMMLPGQEIMLYYCDGWSVGSLCQAPSTIEIGDWFGEVEPVATAPHAICLAAKAVEENGRLP